MGKKYTQSFKGQAVKKALMERSNGVHLEAVAKELGVGYSTLQKWIKQLSVPESSSTRDQRPSEWSAKQRLEAVQAVHELSESDLSAYCRSHGIYPHHITQWQKEFESMANPNEQLKVEREEKRQLKSEVKALQKELCRKDKALAEAAALLILQKKAQAIWGDPEDN